MSTSRRYTRDEFEVSSTTSTSYQDGYKRQPRVHVYSTLLEMIESDAIFKPAVIAGLVIFGLIACTALGLAIWSLLAGNAAKDAGAAAITSIQTQGAAMAAQLATLAATVSSVSSQEAAAPPPLTLEQVFDAICASGDGIIGLDNTTGFTQDDCDSIYIVASTFKVPSALWAASTYEACAMFGPTLDGLNQFRMALYTDDGYGVPQDLIGASDIGTVDGNAISCVPMNLTLGETEYFWLALMSNANDCGALNSLYYATNPGLRSGFTDAYTWPDFPDTLNTPSFTYFSAVYGMYLGYNATCISKFA